MTELTLFISTFVTVFCLGFQSLNVNRGHYIAAFMTSFGIGLGSLFLYKLMPESNPTEIAAFLMGGPFGIISSMYVHRRTLSKHRKEATWPR